ncbi:MAG: TolC family protein [Syntrophotaleaceae bacterium]
MPLHLLLLLPLCHALNPAARYPFNPGHNLNLQAEQFFTRASQAAVDGQYGLYDPHLLVDLATGESQQQLNLQFYEADSRSRFTNLNVALEQWLPSGAQLTLGFDNQRSEEDPPPGIDPAYEGELALQLTQPLLKGFGRQVTEQEILFAVNDRQVAVQDLRELAFALLAGARDTYFEVLRLRDNLRFRETSVALARKILKEAEARVRVGVLPPVDILEAEFGLKERERLLLDADREFKDGLDQLTLLMSAPGPLMLADETLGQPALVVDAEDGFRQALTKRPDLQRRIRQLERLGLEQRLARDALLPGLDLSARYSHKGLGEDYGDNLDDIGGSDYPNWQVGLSFSYPLGNRSARHEYRRTLLQINGQQAELAQLHEEIRAEIRAAIRLQQVNEQKVEVATSGLAFAEEKLRILLKRQEVGLATIRQVLEGEEDLAQARTDRVAALADYNKAVTRYLQSTGQLLEAEGVRFEAALEDLSSSLLQVGPDEPAHRSYRLPQLRPLLPLSEYGTL